MIAVNRIVYGAFETPDIEAQIDHYTRVMGLSLIDNDGEAAYLTTSGDHQSVVLRKGSEQSCGAIGFQLPPGTDLGDYEKQINALGINTTRQTSPQPGISEAVVFEDAKGTKMECYVEAEGTNMQHSLVGISPNKLGHIAFNCTDVQGDVKFYCDVLGFKVSDWMGDFFAFLRCGPDHHSINLVSGKKVKMHHIAFELRDWTHIRDACDHLSLDRTPVLWGPVRHGIGHNISIYHKNPDGQIIEQFCELDVVDETRGEYMPRRYHQSFPQEAGRVWEDIQLAANLWGSPPPEGFLD